MIRSTRWRDLLVFTGVWVPYALLTWHFWFVCDDAFISFRYARNWVAGHGLRYNLGNELPVEGYSNFLWVVACAVVEFFRADPTLWVPLVSGACGSVLLYLVFRVLRVRFGTSLPVAALAAAALGWFPPFAVWSSSGLETMAFALLTFVTFERLALRRERMAPVAGGLAGLATALIRIEGLAWAVLIGVLALLGRYLARQKCRRAMLIFCGILGVGFGVYFGCRYAYYERPLANTAYAKAGMSVAGMLRGLKYVGEFVLTFITPALVAPAALVALRKVEKSVAVPVLGFVLANLGYAVAVGGDWMTMGRILIHGLVVGGALLLGWLLHACWGRSVGRRAFTFGLGASVIALGLLPGWDIHLVPESVRARLHFRYNKPDYRSEFEQWVYMRDAPVGWTRAGQGLKTRTRPGETCVLGAIGAVGYYSDLYVYDTNGLVTAEVILVESSAAERSPGHDKHVPFNYFLKYHPTLLCHVLKPLPRAAVLSHAQSWQKSEWGRAYVPDVIPISDPQDDGQAFYIIYFRRIDVGVDPATAWQQFYHGARFLP
ncbi:MAG: hypothetical protein KKB50_08900 [Planctomycetes bacterium]|nr:hypothetical protein [Planctomycetota bacterium]